MAVQVNWRHRAYTFKWSHSSTSHSNLKYACSHFLSLAQSSSNSYNLCQIRTLSTFKTQDMPPSTSLSQLTCPFVANITTSDLRISAASGILPSWLHSIVFPIKLRSACGQGLCLSIGLTSRHQPLGSPSCMTFMHKPYSFVSKSRSMPLPGPGVLVAQPLSLLTHSKLPNELVDTHQDSA